MVANSSYKLKTAPVIEPVSLKLFKDNIGEDDSDRDELLDTYLKAARKAAEDFTNRGFITQTWVYALDAWPDQAFELPRAAPLQSVEEVRIYAADDTPSVVDASLYSLDLRAMPGIIRFASGGQSSPGRSFRGIEIEYKTGYGDTANDVPADVKTAILTVATEMWDRRSFQLGTEGQKALMPLWIPRL